MLHKHPSAEKAQSYFGITEKLKHDAANFFIYIQPKLSYIYDNSIARALGDHFNSKEVRDKHVAHLSTLLTGGIDQRFINESHQIRKKYAKLGVTTGEYIKLYQLIISYLSGEAHKKHWWRYKKYRDLNRSIRNLVLFDLAIGTSPREVDATLHELGTTHSLNTSQLTKTISAEVQQAVTEITMLIEKSYNTLNECYKALQSALDAHEPPQPTTDTLKAEVKTPTAQASLFENEIITDDIKAPSNENKPAFMKILSRTRKKIYKASQLITTGANDPQSLEKVLNEIQEDIDTLSHLTPPKPTLYEDSKNQNVALHTLLKKSTQAIQSNLNNLEELKENQAYIK